MKARVKFGDSRSNPSRDIRLPHFLTNEDDDNDDAGVRRSSHKGKTFYFTSPWATRALATALISDSLANQLCILLHLLLRCVQRSKELGFVLSGGK